MSENYTGYCDSCGHAYDKLDNEEVYIHTYGVCEQDEDAED